MTSEGEGLRLVDRAACSHLCLSSLEPALAGEIRREPVQAEGERELTAVVEIVLNDVPDHPLARKAACLSRTSRMLDNVIQVSRRKAGERVRHHLH